MSEKYRSANDIMTDIFSNISVEKINNSINIINGWKSVISSIKSNNNKNIGEYLTAHSRVIDLKNGVLLVETDHPGYIQTLKMYNSYILKGLNSKYSELNIKSLSFRLKGSNLELKNIEKTENIKEKYTEEEIENKLSTKKELPEKLEAQFEKLKEQIKNRYIDQK